MRRGALVASVALRPSRGTDLLFLGWNRLGNAAQPQAPFKTESCSSARLEHHTDNVGVGGSSPPGTTGLGD